MKSKFFFCHQKTNTNLLHETYHELECETYEEAADRVFNVMTRPVDQFLFEKVWVEERFENGSKTRLTFDRNVAKMLQEN